MSSTGCIGRKSSDARVRAYGSTDATISWGVARKVARSAVVIVASVTAITGSSRRACRHGRGATAEATTARSGPTLGSQMPSRC